MVAAKNSGENKIMKNGVIIAKRRLAARQALFLAEKRWRSALAYSGGKRQHQRRGGRWRRDTPHGQNRRAAGSARYILANDARAGIGSRCRTGDGTSARSALQQRLSRRAGSGNNGIVANRRVLRAFNA